MLKDLSLKTKTGEILGVVGVEGNGQSELVDVLFGYKRAEKGRILIQDMEISNFKIKEIRERAKVAYIPEDRMRQGIAASASIKENIIASYYDREELNHKFMMNHKAITKVSDQLVKDFNVLCQSSDTEIQSLSGGNIQKVVVAREYYANPEFLIAEQPTRGVDIGSARFIHEKLIELRNKNKSILLFSADLGEALAVSDKIILMYSGEIVAYFDNLADLTEKELGFYMLGVKRQSPEEIRRLMDEKIN